MGAHRLSPAAVRATFPAGTVLHNLRAARRSVRGRDRQCAGRVHLPRRTVLFLSRRTPEHGGTFSSWGDRNVPLRTSAALRGTKSLFATAGPNPFPHRPPLTSPPTAGPPPHPRR